MKEAVTRSFEYSKDTVEEAARSAAEVACDAAEAVKEKMKRSVSGERRLRSSRRVLMNFKYVVALTHVFFSVCLFDRCLNNKVLPRLICFVLLITPTYFFLYIRIDHVTCRIVILHYPLRAKNILDSANFLSWFVKKMIYLRLFLHRGLEISSINHIKCLWSHSSLFASDI